MKIVRIVVAVFISLSFQFCKQPDSPSHPIAIGSELADIETEVKHTLEKYHADIRTSGILAEFNYLDSTDNFFWIPPGYYSPLNFDSVAIILKQNAPSVKTMDNSFISLKIIPHTPDLASYAAVIRSICTDTSNHITSVSLIESGLLVRRSDGWKLLNGQTSLLNDK